MLAWLMTNWIDVLVAVIAIDQVLIGIFPQVPLFGSLKGILQALMGSKPPQLK